MGLIATFKKIQEADCQNEKFGEQFVKIRQVHEANMLKTLNLLTDNHHSSETTIL